MGVMKSAIDYVVGMVPMGNSLMSAARTMNMGIFMLDPLTSVWIRFVNLQAMFIIVVAVFVVQMTIMQVVGMIPVSDLGMTTVLTVYMVMILMYHTFFVRHRLLPQFCCLVFVV
jgi:hypothetical protein